MYVVAYASLKIDDRLGSTSSFSDSDDESSIKSSLLLSMATMTTSDTIVVLIYNQPYSMLPRMTMLPNDTKKVRSCKKRSIHQNSHRHRRFNVNNTVLTF